MRYAVFTGSNALSGALFFSVRVEKYALRIVLLECIQERFGHNPPPCVCRSAISFHTPLSTSVARTLSPTSQPREDDERAKAHVWHVQVAPQGGRGPEARRHTAM